MDRLTWAYVALKCPFSDTQLVDHQSLELLRLCSFLWLGHLRGLQQPINKSSAPVLNGRCLEERGRHVQQRNCLRSLCHAGYLDLSLKFGKRQLIVWEKYYCRLVVFAHEGLIPAMSKLFSPFIGTRWYNGTWRKHCVTRVVIQCSYKNRILVIPSVRCSVVQSLRSK